jgi:cytidylate kinase
MADERRLIVTIDGPAGTGKSSVARAAARRLGLEFLDTGAMYRAATAVAIDRGVDPLDEHAVADLAVRANLRFDWTTDPPTLMAFGKPMMARLRDPDVEAAVSAVSGLAGLRRVMVESQRAIGLAHARLVTEGRDQGSVVFPDAEVKIYLDATAAARAARRAAQMRSSGVAADEAEVERELIERDRQDSTRAVGPLVRPPDAALVDTSRLGLDDVVAEVVRIVERRTGRAGAPGKARLGAPA